jgi:hypothetical protein
MFVGQMASCLDLLSSYERRLRRTGRLIQTTAVKRRPIDRTEVANTF